MANIRCPKCGKGGNRVYDSRVTGADGLTIRRRRECFSCKHRFATYEVNQKRYEQFKKQEKFIEFVKSKMETKDE